MNFTSRGVRYADIDGYAVVEGDIEIGTVEEVRAIHEAGGPAGLEGVIVTGDQLRWPDATIPYEIDPALPAPERVRSAITHWEEHTRIRFEKRTASNAARFPDFVRFVRGDSCRSPVGRVGGQQFIRLADDCPRDTVIHEIGHAVGLWHEHSRMDRDQFITVHLENIAPEQRHNFDQNITDGDDVGPYDYASIMHYPPWFLATSPDKPTFSVLRPVPEGVVVGEVSKLSIGDINAVIRMYPAPPPKLPQADVTFKEPVKDPQLGDPPKPPAHLEPLGPPSGTPFVLATPHQAPGLADRPDGNALADEVRRLGAQVLTLQQALSVLVTDHNSLVARLRPLGVPPLDPPR
ncbi:M12 family metallopeptidase [Streptomyces zaomyceticus]|uniref:M12 family metallopeptidase n=1 Tax=Streptomyces zaomyceticus TaxID=68286 RepID=UPI00344135A3